MSVASNQPSNAAPEGIQSAQPPTQGAAVPQMDRFPPPRLAIAGAKMYHAPPRRASVDGGVKKRWTLDQLRATDAIVPQQSGTNKFASQHGMTSFGMTRNTSTKVQSDNPTLFPSDGCHSLPLDRDPNDKFGRWTMAELKQTEAMIPLQSGTNRLASQKGMTSFGTARDVKGSHLKRIWELEYPEAMHGYTEEQITQEALNTMRS